MEECKRSSNGIEKDLFDIDCCVNFWIGNEYVYRVVQEYCPNLTCCFDCRIDDFCYDEGCELLATANKYCIVKNKEKIADNRSLKSDDYIEKRLENI